jgi:hypothetical protein
VVPTRSRSSRSSTAANSRGSALRRDIGTPRR